MPITQPEGYDRSDYELLVRYCQAGYVPEFNKFDRLINGKIDMNNHGAISTDFIGQNHAFPEAGYEDREAIFQRHVNWVKGLLWFWANDPVVDSSFQDKFRAWGWPRDEFIETGGFPHALYVREARSLVGGRKRSVLRGRSLSSVSPWARKLVPLMYWPKMGPAVEAKGRTGLLPVSPSTVKRTMHSPVGLGGLENAARDAAAWGYSAANQ